jgi:DNA-binding protein HU-beta
LNRVALFDFLYYIIDIKGFSVLSIRLAHHRGASMASLGTEGKVCGMRKHDAIGVIARELGVPRLRAEEIYGKIIDQMITQLGKGNRVTLSGFGTFEIVTRRPKLGRNPRTGDRLMIPQHLAVKFRMGKTLQRGLAR